MQRIYGYEWINRYVHGLRSSLKLLALKSSPDLGYLAKEWIGLERLVQRTGSERVGSRAK